MAIPDCIPRAPASLFKLKVCIKRGKAKALRRRPSWRMAVLLPGRVPVVMGIMAVAMTVAGCADEENGAIHQACQQACTTVQGFSCARAPARCVQECTASSTVLSGCDAEQLALFRCTAERPAEDFECIEGRDGPQLRVAVCEQAQADLQACASGSADAAIGSAEAGASDGRRESAVQAADGGIGEAADGGIGEAADGGIGEAADAGRDEQDTADGAEDSASPRDVDDASAASMDAGMDAGSGATDVGAGAGSAGSPGQVDAGGGSSPGLTELCEAACVKSDALQCPNDPPDCAADCMLSFAESPACVAEVTALLQCIVEQPELICDEQGLSNVADSACDASATALTACLLENL